MSISIEQDVADSEGEMDNGDWVDDDAEPGRVAVGDASDDESDDGHDIDEIK
jgi:hypothetical protein